MKQSRLMSLVESVANVIVGYGVAVVTQILIFPIFGLHTTLAQNLKMGAIFTIVSIARSFALRRVFEANLVPAATSSVVPQSIRTLAPISEPRLDAASETAWYLAASPNQIDTIEYAYLEGQQGAYIETRNGFDVDGVEIKCRLDFGAKAIDWRGLYKNPGA